MPRGPKLERLDPPASGRTLVFRVVRPSPEGPTRSAREESITRFAHCSARRRSAIRGIPHVARGLEPMFETNLRVRLRPCPRAL